MAKTTTKCRASERVAKTSRRTASKAEPWSYPTTESIGLLLRTALFGLRSSYKATLARHEVPWSAWCYLRVLWDQDGISQRELTERVGVMQPNTVEALRGLERDGLVKVEPSMVDRRGTVVWLTAQCRSLMKRMVPEMRELVSKIVLKDLTPGEEAELRRLLNKVCANMWRDGAFDARDR